MVVPDENIDDPHPIQYFLFAASQFRGTRLVSLPPLSQQVDRHGHAVFHDPGWEDDPAVLSAWLLPVVGVVVAAVAAPTAAPLYG